jgi:hypothetical protein
MFFYCNHRVHRDFLIILYNDAVFIEFKKFFEYFPRGAEDKHKYTQTGRVSWLCRTRSQPGGVRLSACNGAWWYHQHLFGTTKCANVAKATFAFSEVSFRPLNYALFLLRALRLIPPANASTALSYCKSLN